MTRERRPRIATGERALERARALDRELRERGPRGPLHGIPVAVKDLYDTAGIRTTAGSAQWASRVPGRDAEAVRRLEAAGAVLVGKLNMDEFAYNYTSETSYFGPARNPWDRRRSPGGSSGGSAIAVAAGMCMATLGSDTGGSIRLPAALCGIAGFKPTYGRISTEGAAPLAWSLDHVGPMCRTAADAELVYGAIADSAATAPPRDLRTVRIGVPRAVFFDGLEPESARLVEDAIRALGKLAGGVREVRLLPLEYPPQLPDLPEPYVTVISTEAYAFHRDMLARNPGGYHPGTRSSIEGGARYKAADYILKRRDLDRLRAASDGLFAEAGLLAMPSAPGAAFELGKPGGLVFLRNLAPWNLYGLPAISIPCGFTASGLPVGLQIVGPRGADGLVLAMAKTYEQAAGWHTRRPPV